MTDDNAGAVTLSPFLLTHYHTMPHFEALKIYSCNKQFLLFSQCFLPYMAHIFHFKCTLKCHLQLVSIWTSLKFCHLVMGEKSQAKNVPYQTTILAFSKLKPFAYDKSGINQNKLSPFIE